MPSRGGPPENISLKGTVCLLKSVFQPLAENQDDLSSSSKFGSGSTILAKAVVLLGALVPSVSGDGVAPGPRISGVGVASGLGVLAIPLAAEAGEDEDARIGSGSVSSVSKVPVRPSPATIPITANKPSSENGFKIFIRKFMMLFQFDN